MLWLLPLRVSGNRGVAAAAGELTILEAYGCVVESVIKESIRVKYESIHALIKMNLGFSEWIESTWGPLESILIPLETRSLCQDSKESILSLPESILVSKYSKKCISKLLTCGRHHRSDVYVSQSDSGGLRANVPTYNNSGLSGVVHDRGSLDQRPGVQVAWLGHEDGFGGPRSWSELVIRTGYGNVLNTEDALSESW
ncbi:hypothetical protein PIB30_096584 [Stylosanthes scabra]|uniref:Uncharacterized protein n=1 Tax=Stylosanthes scabra TaxID=79078 RepID=A0ABU6ZUU3_9FABA|nr:hypothetical protein [Stylosanthes scabra]